MTNFENITERPKKLADWLAEHMDFCEEISCDECFVCDKCSCQGWCDEDRWFMWLTDEVKE